MARSITEVTFPRRCACNILAIFFSAIFPKGGKCLASFHYIKLVQLIWFHLKLWMPRQPELFTSKIINFKDHFSRKCNRDFKYLHTYIYFFIWPFIKFLQAILVNGNMTDRGRVFSLYDLIEKFENLFLPIS